MNLISIPALQDNYIWLLSNKENRCVIVDPGEASPVLDALAQHALFPEAILLTHHHNDHVGVFMNSSNITLTCLFLAQKKPLNVAQPACLRKEIPSLC